MALEQLTASVESAHISPGSRSVDTLTTAFALSEVLKTNGYVVDFRIVLDDVLPSTRPASPFWRNRIEHIGSNLIEGLSDLWSPMSIIHESDFIPRSLELVEEIRDKVSETPGVRLTNGGNSLVMGSGDDKRRVRLMRYRHLDDLPSCEVMDLAMYEKRLSSSDETFTVIDENYRDQQHRVRALADILGWALPVSIICVNESGEPSDYITSWLSYDGSLDLSS